MIKIDLNNYLDQYIEEITLRLNIYHGHIQALFENHLSILINIC